ncbi:ThuA domain-containing protein [Agromyces seonyuensis]|uniref:ThuA-like domain-containing protein n=1 Tax=Agromyces seonyuensis TaxID=2662446 RepID=A0A6I4NRW4_9MICO|nr:ThuA domain-containing protein [Agromyces seonyuensis]MWB96950.1 hypothetical protein [Agromyces seonyuensis]
MQRRFQRLIAGPGAVGVALSLGLVASPAHADDDERYRVLVVGETLGFRHSHIDETTNAVIALGAEHGFDVDVWDPPQGNSPGQPALTLPSSPFTTAGDLAKYATIIFASPVDGTNNLDPARPRLLDDTEVAAFQGYIRGGGGYVGLHAATDTLHTVPWYSELTGGGARFRNHPAQQTATMRVENPSHPSTQGLPAEWVRFDEWYNYTTNPREDVHVLLTLDESTYTGGTMGEDHPLSWCQNFEGGRSWYEGAGHTDASWTDPVFLQHILGGIEWTAGLTSGGGDCVTFAEVDAVLAGVGLSDKVEAGIVKVERKNPTAGAALRKAAERLHAALVAKVAGQLDAAELAADAGDTAGAIKSLQKAAVLGYGFDDETLRAKIADLVEWQRGLAG